MDEVAAIPFVKHEKRKAIKQKVKTRVFFIVFVFGCREVIVVYPNRQENK